MNDNHPQISVIVPVYNVEKYIKKCIDSILRQTYKELEIILVDDGSPDNCGNICDEYKKKDKRVKVIHRKNGGLSAARNAGLDEMSGEYVTFIDSDDWIDIDMIETLYSLLNNYKCDISAIGFNNIYESGKVIPSSKNNRVKIYNKQKALECFLFNEYLNVCVCGKLWKKDLWRNIRFPEGKLFEDHYTTYKLLDLTNSVVFDPRPKYNYFKRDGSIGHSEFNNKTYDLYDAVNEECKYIIEKYPEIYASITAAKITWEIVFANMLLRSSHTDNEIIMKIRESTATNIRVCLTCKYISIVRKLQIILFAKLYLIYKMLYLNYKKRYKLG